MKTKKKLFKVTLRWCADEPTQGDYSSCVWAKDHTDAVKLTAVEMADEDKQSPGSKERREFVKQRIAEAKEERLVEDVACSVKSDIHDLLTGPGGKLTAEAERAKRVIFDLLAMYGGAGCES